MIQVQITVSRLVQIVLDALDLLVWHLGNFCAAVFLYFGSGFRTRFFPCDLLFELIVEPLEFLLQSQLRPASRLVPFRTRICMPLLDLCIQFCVGIALRVDNITVVIAAF